MMGASSSSEGLAQRPVERDEVVAGHGPDVGDTEVLEEPSRLARGRRRRGGIVATTPGGAGRQRGMLATAASQRRREPRQRRESLMRLRYWLTAPDRGRDAHLVVVEQDDDAGLALADVVEGLERQAAHERGVPDDDGDVLAAAALVARQGQALGDRDAGARVAAVHDVVHALGPAREATDAAQLAQRVEALQPARQELVRVGLVAGVPDDAVRRAGEDPMERHRELDDAERAAQVAARLRDRLDDASRAARCRAPVPRRD